MKNQLAIINSILNSCIQIEETRINRQLTIPQQIIFQLDFNTLCQIEKIKESNFQLTLSPNNLADLRYYALLNSPLEQKVKFIPQAQLTSQLTFTSSYPSINLSQRTAVVRSSINLGGQITHQIRQDLWQSPQLFSQVIEVHHWLILQILTQLPIKTKNSLTKLISKFLESFFLLLWTILSFCFWRSLPLDSLYKVLIIGLSFYVFTKYGKEIIKRQFRLLITYSLCHGSWANSSYKRQIVWNTIMALS